MTGQDLRTPGHQGSLTLVSGFKAVTSAGGSIPGFARMSLTFEPVPEPGTWALLAAGLGSLAAGRRRRSRGYSR